MKPETLIKIASNDFDWFKRVVLIDMAAGNRTYELRGDESIPVEVRGKLLQALQELSKERLITDGYPPYEATQKGRVEAYNYADMAEIKTESWMERVVALVTERQGCKAMELAMDMPATIQPGITELIQACVNAGLLIEVEYSLPSMSYRAKNFLLPAGSEVVVNSKEKSE